MKRRRGGLFSVLLLVVPLLAQAAPPAARPLTIDLFSARMLHALTFTPIGSNSSMRACAACPRRAVSSPITLRYGALGADGIGAGGQPVALSFEGTFRVRTSDAPVEIAASGLWKIKVSKGRIHLLLTMPSERYVAFALNGEAAPDEPLESLKALAIVMRTYALINVSRHAASGFNLCDSTHCQVLRCGKVRPEIEAAVLETSGETLWYGPRRANVFYTQNCGGRTEDAASVWPGPGKPYLESHADPYCLRRSSRWHAEIPESEVQAIGREQGWRIPPHIERAQVVRSTASGRASLVQMEGAGARASVSASSLRFAIDRALGWNKLRSDWYTVTVSNGILRFSGQGFGHGVGLCQAGAYEMAAEGKSARAILSFYFPGTQVRIGAGINARTGQKDQGWQEVEGKGWTLVTAASDTALLRAGNTAWGEAQALFPSRTLVHPLVRLMPTTELFRQTTSEPGWILAAARGPEVFLQPIAALASNGGASATLLHEFLHVLVEREAGAQAPLWLREGLVEVLAAPGQSSREAHIAFASSDAARGAATLAARLDATLRHPQDQAQSQRAHAISAALTRDLIARFGRSEVLGWLRTVVPQQALGSLRYKHDLYQSPPA